MNMKTKTTTITMRTTLRQGPKKIWMSLLMEVVVATVSAWVLKVGLVRLIFISFRL